jgi:hypothetical protein
MSLAGLGAFLLDTGRAEEAEPLLRESLAIREELLPEGHHDRGESLSLLGRCLADLGQEEEGQALMDDGLATLVAALGRDDPRTRAAQRRRDGVVQGELAAPVR